MIFKKKLKIILKNIDRYPFRTYISNGDLTDTNICLNNKICDTEYFGYNIVICDLAIFFISIIYGRWIYPKYNSQAHKFRKNKIINAKLKISKVILIILFRIYINIKKESNEGCNNNKWHIRNRKIMFTYI